MNNYSSKIIFNHILFIIIKRFSNINICNVHKKVEFSFLLYLFESR